MEADIAQDLSDTSHLHGDIAMFSFGFAWNVITGYFVKIIDCFNDSILMILFLMQKIVQIYYEQLYNETTNIMEIAREKWN